MGNEKFNKDVLYGLLKSSLNSEEMLKKHFGSTYKNIFTFFEDSCAVYKEIKTHTCSILDGNYNNSAYKAVMSTYNKFKLKDSVECYEYKPKYIEIKFSEEPSLVLRYEPKVELKTESNVYKVPYITALLTGIEQITINEVTKTFTESYKLTHGKVVVDLSKEEVESIYLDFQNKFKNYEHKYDLDKALKRLHDLKKN